MMEDMPAQPDDAGFTIWRGWPRNPRLLSDDETSIDLEASTTVFRLLDLPTEVVTNVFESVAPAPLPAGTGLPLPTDILDSQKALINLRLTSKFCKEIAFPMMYRNIIITSRKQMANILVHLITHQDRCVWVRSLAVVADLTFQEISMQDDRAILTRLRGPLETNEISSQSEVLTKAIAGFKRDIYQLYDDIQSAPLDFTPSDRYEWRIRWFYYRLLRVILYLGIRVEDLLITAPNVPDSWHNENNRYYRKVVRGDLDEMISGELPPSSSDEAAFGDTFKSLRRIRTQSDLRNRGHLEPLPHSLEFLKCQQWEFLGDGGDWWSFVHPVRVGFANDPSKYLGIFSHVTELTLHDSKTHPWWLRRCFCYVKHLKTFSYTTRATEWNHEFPNIALTFTERDVTLQQALYVVSDTLTELRLGWVPWGADLTEYEQEVVAPHRVDVSAFPRLKSIEIDPAFVFREDQDESKSGDGDDTK